MKGLQSLEKVSGSDRVKLATCLARRESESVPDVSWGRQACSKRLIRVLAKISASTITILETSEADIDREARKAGLPAL